MDTVGACAPCRKAGCCHAAMPSPVKKCTGRLSGSVLSRVPGTRTTSDCKAIGAAAPFFTCQNRIALHGSRRERARDPCRTGRFDHAATSLPDVQGAPSRHGFMGWPRTAHRGVSAAELLSQETLPGNRSRLPAGVSHKVIEKSLPKSGFSFHSPARPMAATVHPVLFNNQNCRS